jgi:small-conductance mechanosensitive channel
MAKPRSVSDILPTLLPLLPDWLLVLAVVAGAIALGVIAHWLLHCLLLRLARHHPAKPFLSRTSGISRYALVVLAVSAALPLAPLSPANADMTHKCLLAAFIVLAGWLVMVALNIGLDRYSRRFRLEVADNLTARRAVTQLRIVRRTLDGMLLLLTAGFALMSFDSVRQFGFSLFASAGVAGIAAGLAARPLLGNLIAGIQIAIAQPIRLGDVLIIAGEWGTVEEINATYVVLKIWDMRRLIVPLSFFFDNVFENWTRTSAQLLGTVFLYVDYTVPVDKVRARLEEIVRQSRLWDRQVVGLQVTDAKEQTLELRCLMSAADSGAAFELRCEVREKLVAWIGSEFPGALPRRRNEAIAGPARATPA